MFQFGFFSTHIPYIITIVAYLLSYGLYAINKSSTGVNEQNIVALSSDEVRLEGASTQHSYDTTSHFQELQVVDLPNQNHLPLFTSSTPFKVCYPPDDRVVSSYRAYALFSRPPTFC